MINNYLFFSTFSESCISMHLSRLSSRCRQKRSSHWSSCSPRTSQTTRWSSRWWWGRILLHRGWNTQHSSPCPSLYRARYSDGQFESGWSFRHGPTCPWRSYFYHGGSPRIQVIVISINVSQIFLKRISVIIYPILIIHIETGGKLFVKNLS